MKTGRQLDIILAETLMGWKRMSWKDYHKDRTSKYVEPDTREELTYSWHNQDGEMNGHLAEDTHDYYAPENAWSPSTEIEDALEVADKIESYFRLYRGYGDIWEATFIGAFSGSCSADTAPRAISLAAVQAIA